jgi:polyhydroxybutyrate depolymerase
VAANGLTAAPSVERGQSDADGFVVTLRRWAAPPAPPVALYLVEGGGHTWPGAPQYLPARLVGPVAAGLDATGIILATFRDRQTG